MLRHVARSNTLEKEFVIDCYSLPLTNAALCDIAGWDACPAWRPRCSHCLSLTLLYNMLEWRVLLGIVKAPKRWHKKILVRPSISSNYNLVQMTPCQGRAVSSPIDIFRKINYIKITSITCTKHYWRAEVGYSSKFFKQCTPRMCYWRVSQYLFYLYLFFSAL